MTDSSNNKTSYLVNSQVPFFVRNDHPNFVKILESYYEFLEQQGAELDILKNMRPYNDVDTSIDPFLQKFYDILLKFIPKEASVDKTLIVKNIKDFYRSRGTEKSVRFLMRLMFDEEISSFYYPKKDVLRLSDGKWFIEKSIKVSDIKINGVANNDLTILNNISRRRIIGNTSNALATVEKADSYFESGELVREIKIANQVRTFIPGESIHIVYDENGMEKILTANIFSGNLNTVEVIKPGTGYSIGDLATIEGGSTGQGGIVFVSSVSTGNIASLRIVEGGAGFQAGNPTFFSGGGGSGANASVSSVKSDSSVHPNSYNIVVSTISLEANTLLSNSIYSNLSSSNVNTSIANAVSYFVYANTGPVQTLTVISSGDNYVSSPGVSIVANSIVRSLGILGAMRIVDGGLNYSVGDTITFTNIDSGFGTGTGTGAAANVTSVAANGRIEQVRFVRVPGHTVGGSGYAQFNLPAASVNSANGNGANIIVTTTLGLGEVITANSGTIGAIRTLTISSKGSGYTTPTTINLTSIGDGTAQAVATIITGTLTYPGRYLNDDGHLSGYNFIQDRDYYQNFSYVLKLKRTISEYRQAMKELIHPAGMKLFGEYMYEEFKEASVLTSRAAYASNTYIATFRATSNANGELIVITSKPTRNVISAVGNSNVFLQFVSNTTNLVDGIYSAQTINVNSFRVYTANTVMTGTVSANSGNGNTTRLFGTGTNFTALKAGDNIRIAGLQNTFTVGAVSNNTQLFVTGGSLPVGISGNTYFRIFYPANSNGTLYFTRT
jgi:hypothetical protein